VALWDQLWDQNERADRSTELQPRALRERRPQATSVDRRRSLKPAYSWRRLGPPNPAHIFGSIEVEGVTRLAKHPH
jgi:hypothetical protein